MGDYVEFAIEQGDVRTFVCDVIALKYARNPRGADRAVAEMPALKGVNPQDLTPDVGEHRLVQTRGSVKAAYAVVRGRHRRHFRGESERVPGSRLRLGNTCAHRPVG